MFENILGLNIRKVRSFGNTDKIYITIKGYFIQNDYTEKRIITHSDYRKITYQEKKIKKIIEFIYLTITWLFVDVVFKVKTFSTIIC